MLQIYHIGEPHLSRVVHHIEEQVLELVVGAGGSVRCFQFQDLQCILIEDCLSQLGIFVHLMLKSMCIVSSKSEGTEELAKACHKQQPPRNGTQPSIHQCALKQQLV